MSGFPIKAIKFGLVIVILPGYQMVWHVAELPPDGGEEEAPPLRVEDEPNTRRTFFL